MAGQINRHGLTRESMSAAVKRAVRQRCGFGCVVCGNAFIEYDHFDPPFEDAKEQHPEGIVLLCLEHHGLKTKSEVWLPAEQVRRANQAPKATTDGFATWSSPKHQSHPVIVFGDLTCVEVGRWSASK